MMRLPNIDMTATGIRIKTLREKNGYTVVDLQHTLGLATKQAVYKWQKGKTLPNTDNLLALAWLFHVKIEDILVFTVPAENPSSTREAA